MDTLSLPSSPLTNTEWQPVDAEKVVAGTPKTTYKVIYSSASQEFHAGVWQSTPGKWNVSYGEDEFCTLLEGTVILTASGGQAQKYTAPESFVIPSGFNGTWESATNVRKYFVIYEKTLP